DISGNCDIDGTMEADAITLGGTALGALALLDSVAAGQIDANAVDSSELADGSIDESHLNVSNSPTDNYLLSYNSSGSNFTWVESPSGGGGDIDISGTPVDNQLAVWTDADTLEGTDKFTVEPTGLACTLGVYPSADDTYDLGLVNRQWQNLFISDNIWVGAGSGFIQLGAGVDIIPESTDCDLGESDGKFGVCYAESFYGAGGAGASPAGQYSPGPFLADLLYSFSAGLVLSFTQAGSDLDIKENITSFVGPGLSLLDEISPKSFTFKEDYRTAMGQTGDAPTTYGYIAQDVQAIDAKYVETVPDPRNEDNTILKITDEFYADVSHSQIKAIQELSAKNDALEARIAALEAA
ncbi:MAG: tail fiber domain-containing protein, partial [Anaerolineales bacterium]|nr:tail fiber domain-containing protein [Anaerolineales bacterium]